MNKSLFILLFLFIPVFVFSQKINMHGEINKSHAGGIEIVKYADMISFEPEVIANTTIDSNRNFNLQFDINETIFAFIRNGLNQGELYLQSGNNYNLQLIIDTNNQPLAYSQQVNLKLNFITPDSLNKRIRYFNQMYNNFIIKNFNRIYKSRKHYLIDTLQKFVKQRFGKMNSYFSNYVKYKFASIEHFSRKKSLETVINEYIINQPVLYNNIEYMAFFHQVFDDYLFSFSKSVDISDLVKSIKEKGNYLDIYEMASKDTTLRKNNRVIEMVLLNTINELYNYRDIDRNKIINILKAAEQVMLYKENRNIAANLVKKLTKLNPGTSAPPFTLPDQCGKNVSLDGFKGKIVYLNFWNLRCRPCIAELDSIAKINNLFENALDFVSISTDYDTNMVRKFIERKGYNWTFLNFDHNYQLLRDYQVMTFPANILIGKKGKILKHPAKLPAENLQMIINRIANKDINK